MELKMNYQYTYFIYPYAIKQEKYKKYVSNLIRNKKYQLKLFDCFKDAELYKYFVSSVKEGFFQDFSFTAEKLKKFNRLNISQKIKLLSDEKCLIFDYDIKSMQGKTDEKDGIFFNISKVELICFNTGICFLLFKTNLEETDKFSDLLNFNYKFSNITLEEKKINRIDNIKIQTNAFNNMKKISEFILEITGQKVENKKIDIDDSMFLIYTYACLDSSYWSSPEDFSSIENEFIKLAEARPNDVNINVEYDKLSLITDAGYRKIRINDKCTAAICSSTDTENFTKFIDDYENQYLYTYIISLHQKYYLKKINNRFKKNTSKAISNFLEFTNEIWISELTTDSLGQKIYKRYKEKNNLEELFSTVKSKYDIYYKKLKIDKNKMTNEIITILLSSCFILGLANFASWIFLR